MMRSLRSGKPQKMIGRRTARPAYEAAIVAPRGKPLIKTLPAGALAGSR
jgi:hypothetical protein